MASVANLSDIQRLKKFEQQFSFEKQNINYPKITTNFISSSYGCKKFFKLGVINCSWLLNFSIFFHFSDRSIKKIIDVRNNLHLVDKTLLIVKMPKRFVRINEAINNYFKNENNTVRKVEKLVQKLIKTIQESFLLMQLFEFYCLYTFSVFSNKILQFLSKLFLLISSFLKLKIHTQDYIEHNKIQQIAKAKTDLRSKTIIREIQNLDLIKLVKCVTSVVIGIFWMSEFILTTSIVSPIVVLMLSTISCSFSIWSHLYKDSLSYPLIK